MQLGSACVVSIDPAGLDPGPLHSHHNVLFPGSQFFQDLGLFRS